MRLVLFCSPWKVLSKACLVFNIQIFLKQSYIQPKWRSECSKSNNHHTVVYFWKAVTFKPKKKKIAVDLILEPLKSSFKWSDSLQSNNDLQNWKWKMNLKKMHSGNYSVSSKNCLVHISWAWFCKKSLMDVKNNVKLAPVTYAVKVVL